jgi:hypothetical protein
MDAFEAAALLDSYGEHAFAAQLRATAGFLGGLAIGGYSGIPAAGFGPGTPLYAPPARSPLALGQRVDATERVRRAMEGFPVSILGDVLRAPASQPGQSSSLFGDILQSGAQALLGYAGSRTQAKQLKAQRKLLKQMQQGGGYQPLGIANNPIGYGGGAMSILDGSVSPAMIPQQGYSQAPMVEQGGLYTQASYLPAVVEGAGALVESGVGRAVATVAAGAARRLGSYLLSLLPTLGAAGAIDLAVNLIGSGMANGAAGPYANPKHNTVTGVMRGDVIALRRVRRSARRLQKVLRLAGVGGRRGGGRFRRRR